ncbi:hypothetical protein GALMADRAFT_241812 [Galerina marginata CBS 339.88]|uniref:Uncharacterized protein n=1 Tax=Galerina marginata (strain CBS 339.88) TaxID=685588 RepID=A0A067TDK6_GALM3|nr:hypothetical protein GALMADRAFT_241812 [Galerina marginata CBS 339.88]
MVNSELRWHPKITPYRLTVLATTISLGTAKAVSTQMDRIFIQTTFEWVSGTVIFLMLFIVSPYDSEADAPRYLSWFFKPDCMDVVWHLLAVTFSIPRPNYCLDERNHTFRTAYLPITSYRILVSSSLVAFGVTKATFGYLGASTAATWTDWVFGVVATSIFYLLGLYENNSLNLWPAFFADDQRHYLRSASHVTAYTAGISLSVTWILYWKGVLQRTWLNTAFIPLTLKPDAHHTFFEKVFSIAVELFPLELIALSIALGIVGLAFVLYFFAISGSLRVMARPFRAVRARIFGGVLPLFSGDAAADGSISFLGIPNRYIERSKSPQSFLYLVSINHSILL